MINNIQCSGLEYINVNENKSRPVPMISLSRKVYAVKDHNAKTRIEYRFETLPKSLPILLPI